MADQPKQESKPQAQDVGAQVAKLNQEIEGYRKKYAQLANDHEQLKQAAQKMASQLDNAKKLIADLEGQLRAAKQTAAATPKPEGFRPWRGAGHEKTPVVATPPKK